MDVEEIKGKVATAISYAKQIDDKAREQIARMCDYDFTKGSKIRILPDVHAGKGCTIGTTMTVTANGYAKLSYKTAYLKAHFLRSICVPC